LFDSESRARQEAEEANRSKIDFLRAMSHEFRTPLNAIGGFAQVLLMGLRGELSDEQRHAIERIERNQRHAANLISDIVSFARVETGQVRFDLARVTVAELLGELDGYVAPRDGEVVTRHLRIHPPTPGLTVRADPAKTTQVLLNLVTNALKH